MKKKLTAVALIVCMLAIMLVGATMAYFTDETQTEVNTFTMGKVDIELSEPEWDVKSNKLMPGTKIPKDPTVTVQEGSEDCWVFMEVEMNKFNSWLRLVAIQNDSENQNLIDYADECTNEKCTKAGHCQGHFNVEGLKAFFATNAYQTAFDAWFGGTKHDAWEIMNWADVLATLEKSWTNSDIKVVNPIFGYKTVLSAKDEVTLFTSVTMPASVTSEQLADSRFNTDNAAWKMSITAYAIQAENVPTLAEAYTAMFAAE